MTTKDEDIEAIKQLAENWRSGWLAGDADALLSLYADKRLERNCHPASLLNAWPQFGPAAHGQPCVSGGSRSALRSMKRTLPVLAAIAVISCICGCRSHSVAMASMAPTANPGETVRLDHTAYVTSLPERWDIVVFEMPRYPGTLYSFRVVALPGETVSLVTGGISVNGRPVVPPPHVTNVSYVSLDYPAFPYARSSVTSPYVVPTNSYFVLGDNSTRAVIDSRFLGVLHVTNLVGRISER